MAKKTTPPQNSTETGSKPAPGRPFVKGVSGNPGGRPKGLASEAQRRCGKDGKKLVDFWCAVAFGTDAAIKRRFGAKYAPRWEARIQAASELADRGFGKPIQAIEHTGGMDVTLVQEARATLDKKLAQLAARVAASPDGPA